MGPKNISSGCDKNSIIFLPEGFPKFALSVERPFTVVHDDRIRVLFTSVVYDRRKQATETSIVLCCNTSVTAVYDRS